METQEKPKKTGRKKKETPKESGLVKGNMTASLEEGHPFKDYEFENVVGIKGADINGAKVPDVLMDDFYHVYLLPYQGNSRVDSPRKGYVAVKDRIAYQKMAKEKIKFTYHYDEVTILHDPTKK